MKNILSGILFLLAMCAGLSQVSAKTWYVGTWTGKGAQDVKATVQEAIAAAAAGDQVWVAKGVYTLAARIELKDGVSLYGGFAGAEGQLSERVMKAGGRPWEFVNVTILDGNNKTRVLEQTTSDNFIKETVIDGLTIRNGKSSNGTKTGGGAFLPKNMITMQNCIFTGNYAEDAGGGLNISGAASVVEYCYFYNNKAKHGAGAAVANGTMRHCEVVNNTTISTTSSYYAEGWGGGIFNNNAIVENTLIAGNKASFGGGAYLRDTKSVFRNCIIVGNTGKQGGGVAFDSRPKGGSVINCVIANNSAEFAGGVQFSLTSQQMANSVVWGNLAGSDVDHYACKNFNGGATDGLPTIINNAFQGRETVTGTNIAGNIPLPLDSATYFMDGWQNAPGSPCIDKGTMSVIISETDYAGNKRVTGQGVDIGACEQVIGIKPGSGDIFYVKGDAAGGYTGSSWADALTDVPQAVEAAKAYNDKNSKKAKVWVAKGTYPLEATLVMQSGVSVYGGFAGTEKKEEEREKVQDGEAWEFVNETILDGLGVVRCVETPGVTSSTGGGNLASATVLDGVTLKNGKGSGGSSNPHKRPGGATFAKNMSMQYCKVIECTGGGVYLGEASAKASYCYFNNNNATTNGGAVYIEHGTVENCLFEENETTAGGGAIGSGYGGYVYSSIIRNNKAKNGGGIYWDKSATIEGCLIVDNEATEYGGGIYSAVTSSFQSRDGNLINATLCSNKAGKAGGGVYAHDHSSLGKKYYVKNVLFWNNTANGKVENIASKNEADYTLTNCLAADGEIRAGTDIDCQMATDSTRIFDVDWKLKKGDNPCIDKGINSAATRSADLAGNPRVNKGIIDIGAYEYSASAGLKPDAKGIFYVKVGGTGKGSSWTDAAGDIEAILGAAFMYQASHSEVKPQVWVAGGTYLLEFAVKLYDKVNVYGGFAGTEAEVAQRAKVADGKPWEFVNATIIDAQKKCGVFEQSAPYTDETTTFDGFTVQNGKAATGAGILFVNAGNAKGGTVQNCRFLNCEATGFGGGISFAYQGNVIGCYFTGCKAGIGGAVAGVQYNGGVNVTDCEVIGNSSTNRGGGIYLTLNGKIVNCLVMNNNCDGLEGPLGGGGGVGLRSGGTIINSIITNNSARRGGGVMGMYDNQSSTTDIKIINTTIANNTAKENGGGIYRNTNHTVTSHHKKLTVTNTIFWNNKLNNVVNQFQTFRPEVDELVSSALNGESGKLEGIRTDNIVLADSVSNFGEGWTLKETSVCVDNGQEIAGLPGTDFYGKNRKSGLGYDIGACEYQSKFDFHPSAAGVFYVKLAEEQGSGSSWDSPITEVVYAMQSAKSYKEKNPKKSVEVWIAGGTYNVPSAMVLASGVNVYGGFAGTETAVDQRVKVTGGKAWDYQNETVLDGQSKTQVFTQAADFTEQTYVDGVTVKNAKTSSSHGAAMYLKGKATVQYCKFIDCEAVGKNGGAIDVATGKDTKILYSYFYGNKASNGGAIFTENSGPVIEGCWVEKSSAVARGGGIYVYQAKVYSCVVINNHSDGDEAGLGGGGGLYGRDGGKFYNCIVTGNTANRGAGIMSGGNPGNAFITIVANCVIADNVATENGGGVYANATKATYGMQVYNTVFWNNTLNGRANHKMERTQLFNSAVQNGDGIEATDAECINITDKTASFSDNWEPKDGSVCLDKGKSDVEGMPATDIAGNKRISNGKVDIGAYEYLNPADDFTIDFVNEKLSYVLDAAQVVECSAAKEFGEVSAFSDLITKKNRRIYIRLQSAAAKVIAFDVPGRGIPTAAIDFTGDSLKLVSAGSTWDIAQSGVFAEIIGKGLAAYIDGGGKTGVTLRQSATDKAFRTDTIFNIPGRLEAPAGLTLNYISESLEGMDDLTVLEAKTTGKYADLSGASIRNLIPTLGATLMTVRLKATDKDFASSLVEYTLPARPAMTSFSINFETAETKESVPSAVEIDTVATFAYAVRGGDALMALEPGLTYWFRVAASQDDATFASLSQKLIVPARPDMESVVVDFLEEKLIGLPKGAVWDYDETTAEQAKEDISTMIPANGTRTLNIYVNMSDSTFASAAYDLVIPARPNAPAEISLDFRQETLSSALTGLEVKKDTLDYADFRTQSVTPLVPQTGHVTMTMRKKATEEQFASKDTTFTLLARPQMPGACSVDYVGEQTREQIASGLEYVSDSLAAVWTAAQDVPGVLMPGKIFSLRVAASQEARTFASLMWSMKVPVRPEISIHDMEVTFRADSAFVPEMWNSWTNTAEEIVLVSSNSRIAVAEGNTVTLKSIGECDITATRIASEGEYFAAEPKTVTLTVKGANGETGNEKEPVVRDLYIANGVQDMNFRIEDERVDGCSLVFFNRSGKVIFESRSYGNDFNMGSLNAGTYYYVLTYDMNGRQNVKKGFVEIVR